MSNELEKKLQLRPLEVSEISEVVSTDIVSAKSDTLNADVNTARDNLHDAVVVAHQAVQDMLNIAQQSQHPKAYEALNSLIKTYADISMGLADLQLKNQRLQNNAQPKEETEAQVVNNNLFVGSTAELLKMLEDNKKSV